MRINQVVMTGEIIDRLGGVALLLGPDGTVLDANPAALALYGYTCDEIRGLSLRDIRAPQDPDNLDDQMREATERGVQLELVHRRSDGTLFPVEVRTVPVDSDGEAALLCFVRDITERRRIDEELANALTDAWRFREALDHVPAYVYMKNRQHEYVYANRETLELFGCSAEELTGTEDSSLFPPDAVTAIRAADDRVLQLGEDASEEFDFVDDAGSRHVYWDVKAPVYEGDREGEPWGIVGVSTDITERKRTEEALRESETRFRTMFSESPLGIALIDSSTGQLCEANRRFAEIVGRPQSEMEAIDWMAITHPEDVPKELARMKRMNAGEITGFQLDKRFVRPNGSAVWVNMTIAVLEQSDPHDKQHLCMVEDITQRRHTEGAIAARLRIAEYGLGHSLDELIQKALDETEIATESSIAFFHFVDPDQRSLRLQTWSTNTLATQCTSREAGTHYPIDQAGVWVDCIHEGRPIIHNDYESLPNRKGLPEGHARLIRELTAPVYREGKVVAIVGVGNKATDYDTLDVDTVSLLADMTLDVVQAKRAEEALRKTLDELLVRTADLERSNQDLQDFAYVASHDLQEPLRMVASYTRLLQQRYEGRLDSDADEFIAFAVDGVNRMDTLINELLEYSRVGTRGLPLVATDLTTVINRVLENMASTMEESGAVVTCDNLPTVMCDPLQIGRVFQNLIVNAIKFRREETPAIHIGVRDTYSEWVICVKDNGIGIDSRWFNRIFTIFQRLQPMGDYPGTGMGLSICKRIIERHHGRIWVESKLGEGSTFYFTLGHVPVTAQAPQAWS